MSLMCRSLVVLPIAAMAVFGCSDSTAPTGVVPRQLYYIEATGGEFSGWALYGAALDGSHHLPIIEDTIASGELLYPDFAPWISRDGREIKVLVREHLYDGPFSIATVNRQGTLLSLVPYPENAPTYGPWPALSPDGTQLAWIASGYFQTSLGWGYVDIPYLEVVDLDGSLVQKVKFDSLSSAAGDVAWSGDGRSIAYVTWHTDRLVPYPYQDTDIRLMTRRLSDGFTRPVATLSSIAGAPAWSRDGRWLTITAGGSIHRVRADGSGSEQVLYDGGLVGARSSAWGPRDSLVAISAGRSIVLLHPDGGSPRTLATRGLVDGFTWAE
jgi:hypothetical protein